MFLDAFYHTVPQPFLTHTHKGPQCGPHHIKIITLSNKCLVHPHKGLPRHLNTKEKKKNAGGCWQRGEPLPESRTKARLSELGTY